MRGILQMIRERVTLVVGLAFTGLVLMLAPVRPQMLIYPLVRQAVQKKIDYSTGDMLVKDTPHFRIKYTEVDAGIVETVAGAAEAAYEPVSQALNYRIKSRTLILIYPDRTAMGHAYGWSGEINAMGFYWGGVIQILSPAAWMKDGVSPEEFIRTGPLAHEYTHLVLDYMTQGNYSRWFTEGLAQYVEYRLNGYEWITANNRLDEKLYSLKELDTRFDDLPNQSLAYRQSLAAVRYIAAVHGESALAQVIDYLRTGMSTDKAITKALNMDYTAFEQEVNIWAVRNMKNYMTVNK
ncbi:MAG TPA: collagenase [Methylomusa anaerophila]|uniref:Peptidase MA-like domain-containing protein n=1 Tax=Methylomusa anaerophila TaxID=1930071 RepID=A0A348AGN8_9FIRM|nr:collagenase [Methylomusa anaerophila]BBB90236.1 hypothetical protein MAMMFC1_00884 [Methylomusa anaerophila]HML89416.1 collagenase [Methylomusa anaerophila]